MAGGLDVDKPNMFDNIGVNSDDTITLLEDLGNAEHNGKRWQFSPKDGSLKMLAQFDPALFGDIDANGACTAGSHNQG
ncbi:MAG: hypothetical protein ACXV7J_09500 [Methylomonas sp.]